MIFIATRSVLLVHMYSNVSGNRTADIKRALTLSASCRIGYHSRAAFSKWNTIIIHLSSKTFVPNEEPPSYHYESGFLLALYGANSNSFTFKKINIKEEIYQSVRALINTTVI